MFILKFPKIILLGLVFMLGISLLTPVFSLADTIDVGLEVGESAPPDGGGGEPPPPAPVYGCTDPLALNYNSAANTDNGSCIYSSGVPNVANFIASLNTQSTAINLSWTNPSFADFVAVRIVRKIGSIPLDETDGTLIYDGAGQSTIDDDISTDGTYFYTALVRNTDGEYSSGAVAQASISSEQEEDEEEEEEEDGPDNGPSDSSPDPFDSLPTALDFDPVTEKLSLGDFVFFQVGELGQFFGRGSRINLNGQKPFTISLPYDKAPEALKIIGVTIGYPNNPSQVFSFLLRLNQTKTAYEATIDKLPGDGTYPINIHIINFDNQTIKRISGVLQVSNVGALPPNIVASVLKNTVTPLAIGVGVAAGATQALLLTSSGAASLADIYLLVLKGIGALMGFLGVRRRHKPWGTVYDAVTKQPIDPAYVSVEKISAPDDEVASAITDIDGRYGFFLPAGTYRIKAGKTHYEFPSKKLAGRQADELYGNLYFGEAVETAGEEVLNKNIPLDPVGFDWNEFTKNKSSYFKIFSGQEVKRARIFNTVYGLGFAAAFISMMVAPSWLNLTAVFAYLAIFGFSLIWKYWHKPITVKWQKSGEPIAFAIIRFFLADLNQEVKHIITDNLGRFYVLLRPGQYYFTIDEKLPDGSYRKVYQSNPLELKKGILAKDIVIDEPSTLPPVAGTSDTTFSPAPLSS